MHNKTLSFLKSGSLLLSLAAGILAPTMASAYVGPGAGVSVLGALWGLIIGVVMAIGVILFWPIRMMIRKSKAKKTEPVADATATAEASDDDAKAEETNS